MGVQPNEAPKPLAEVVNAMWRASGRITVISKRIHEVGEMGEKLPDVRLCLIDGCTRNAAVNCRGLCMLCYADAKKLVEGGKTTWEQLEVNGLVLPKQSPFQRAFDKVRKIGG